jgi:hypothetical protein
MGKTRNIYKNYGGKPEVKSPLGKHRHRWDFRMNLRQIGWNVVDCIRDRDQWRDLVNTIMNLWVP